jgi:uncharacterized protein (TIRG00374 family)
MTRAKKILSPLIKTLFAVAIIWWLAQSGKLKFSDLAALLHPAPIFTGITLLGINILFASERWYLLLRNFEISISRFAAFRLTLIGVFFNFVVPGGGDLIKGYYIAKHNPHSRMRSIVTVAMDRLIGLYTMVVMAVLALLINLDAVQKHSELKFILLFLSIVFAAFSVFWALVFSRRLSSHPWLQKIISLSPKKAHVESLFTQLSSYSQVKSIFFKTLAISASAQIIAIGLFVSLGTELGYNHITFSTYFFVVPIGFMVTAIPISPAGVGVGQAAFYYLFNLISGFESPAGSVLVTAFQVNLFMWGILGAWFYVSTQHSEKSEHSQYSGVAQSEPKP